MLVLVVVVSSVILILIFLRNEIIIKNIENGIERKNDCPPKSIPRKKKKNKQFFFINLLNTSLFVCLN